MCLAYNNSSSSSPATLVDRAASELESVRRCQQQQQQQQQQKYQYHDEGVHFPQHCRKLLHSLPGNRGCVDCGAPNPDWASVSYGTLLCMNCSGRHRSYGVRTSFVRSISMDTWSHEQILAMLEGGNEQLARFFERHQMLMNNSNDNKRYFTKAANFYRVHLAKHAQALANDGVYKGREASRARQQQQQESSSSAQSQPNAVSTSCRAAVVNEESRDSCETVEAPRV